MDIGRIGSSKQPSSAKHIDQYIQYCNLVGDNGGVLMSEKEYMEYKKNYPKIAENRTYSTWYNSDGLACKNVGPSSKCFCDHTYKNHDYLQGEKVKCKTLGCKCNDFYYIPIYGSQDFKCTCKHSYLQHETGKKNCKKCACKCFSSSWNCSCGMKFDHHKTISEKRQQKQQKGEVVGLKQGAIVSYSSMLQGADRFQFGIKQQVKKKGIKVQIQDFVIQKQGKLREEISGWQLMNKPLSWLK